MSTVDPLCVRAARRWAALYTSGLPDEAVQRRTLELESDMWEHLHDRDEHHRARAVLGRSLRGIPADVRWRYRTLLDARGARQRSQHMNTPTSSRWWVILTSVLAVVPLGISLAMLAVDDGGGLYRMMGLAVSVATAVLLLIGLARQRTDVVSGSQLIVAGAALTVVSGGELILVGIIVVVSGFWTGNLQLSERVDGPDLSPVSQQQDNMTRYWYLWLCTAGALFAIGWLPLVFDDPNDPADFSFGGWYVWVLSWFGAIITGSIGAILAALRLVVRHRTAGVTSPTSPAA